MRENLPLHDSFNEVININSYEEEESVFEVKNKVFKLRNYGLFTQFNFNTTINKVNYNVQVSPKDDKITINNYTYYLSPMSIQIIDFIDARRNMQLLHIQDYLLLSVLSTLLNEPKFISFYLPESILTEMDKEDYIDVSIIGDKILYMIFKSTMLRADSLVLCKENKYVQAYEQKISLIINELNRYIQSVINPFNLCNIKWIAKINNIPYTNPFSITYIYAIIKHPTTKDEFFINKYQKIENELEKSKKNKTVKGIMENKKLKQEQSKELNKQINKQKNKEVDSDEETDKMWSNIKSNVFFGK